MESFMDSSYFHVTKYKRRADAIFGVSPFPLFKENLKDITIP